MNDRNVATIVFAERGEAVRMRRAREREYRRGFLHGALWMLVGVVAGAVFTRIVLAVL